MTVDAQPLEPDRLLRIARTKARLGRFQQAVTHYDDALALRPGFEAAFVEVVDILETVEDWAGIAQRCENWITHYPDHASHGLSDRVHNLRIDALCRIGGIELAYEAYGLEQVTSGPVELDADDIVVVLCARNEATRLPFFLEHHRRLGVTRFFVVDNGSNDGSIEFLRGEPDTVVWSTPASYLQSNCGASWTDLVLRRYVTGQWCLVSDGDELFIYPGFEHRSLHELCAGLDREGATCYPAFVLDMYGDRPLSQATYRPGQDPLEVFPYFDRTYYRIRIPFDGPRRNMTNHWGGFRARIWGKDLGGYLLHRISLFRYSQGEVLMSGYHWLDRPTGEIASGRGGVLHFKYSERFAGLVAEELARREHARRSSAYEVYASALEECPDPVLFDPMHSVRYESSEQLVAMGLMREGPAHERVVVTRDSVLMPEIPPARCEVTPSDRPFWSVVVVAGFDDDTCARVDDVLHALVTAPPSEIVIVIGPGSSPSAASATEQDAGRPHSIEAVPTMQYLNGVESANLGLCHTRGTWVHVLGTDTVSPDFYRMMGEGITDGSAELAISYTDQVSPCIDLDFAVSSARFVARRHLYERARGFCATVSLAAAWEMLQRLAQAAGNAPVPVLIPPRDPELPAAAPAGAFTGYGEEVIHWLAAIDLVRDLVDLTSSDLRALHDRCAMRAADLVREDVEHGRFASALATMGEALRVPLTPAAREHLTAAFNRTL